MNPLVEALEEAVKSLDYLRQLAKQPEWKNDEKLWAKIREAREEVSSAKVALEQALPAKKP